MSNNEEAKDFHDIDEGFHGHNYLGTPRQTSDNFVHEIPGFSSQVVNKGIITITYTSIPEASIQTKRGISNVYSGEPRNYDL